MWHDMYMCMRDDVHNLDPCPYSLQKLAEVVTYKQINEPVVNVFRALTIMISPPSFAKGDLSWATVRAKMGRADILLSTLKAFKQRIDTEDVPAQTMVREQNVTRNIMFLCGVIMLMLMLYAHS